MPSLVCEGGGLVCQSVGMVDLLSDHFDTKQLREIVDLPLMAIRLLLLQPSPSGHERSGVSC